MPDRWTQATEDALTQMLAAEFVVAGTGSRDPNRTAARAVLDWAAHRGLLVEPGGGRAQAAKQMLVASALVPEPAIRRQLAYLAMRGNPIDALTDDEAAYLARITEAQP